MDSPKHLLPPGSTGPRSFLISWWRIQGTLLVQVPLVSSRAHMHWPEGIFLLFTWSYLCCGIDFCGIFLYWTKGSLFLRHLLGFACLFAIWLHQPWTTKNVYSELFHLVAPRGAFFRRGNWSSMPMKRHKMVFYFNTAWPQFSLGSGEQCPTNGSLSYNTIFQLERFSKREGKWDKLPYIQAFMMLYQSETIQRKCNRHRIMMQKKIPSNKEIRFF